MSLLDDDLDEKLTQEFILGQFCNFKEKHLLCSVQDEDTLSDSSMRIFLGREDYRFYKKLLAKRMESFLCPVVDVELKTIQHSSLVYKYENNELSISVVRPELPILIKDYYEESLPEYIKFPNNTLIVALDCNKKLEVDGCLIIFENTYVD